MYQNGPTNTSPDDEPRLSEDDKIRWAAQRAHCESNAKLEALWLHRPVKVLRIVACVAFLCLAAVSSACGGGSADVAEDGTTAARCAEEQPVVQQAPGGVVIAYCGAIRYVPAVQLAAPVAAQIQQSMVRR